MDGNNVIFFLFKDGNLFNTFVRSSWLYLGEILDVYISCVILQGNKHWKCHSGAVNANLQPLQQHLQFYLPPQCHPSVLSSSRFLHVLINWCISPHFAFKEHILEFHRNSGGQAQLAVSDQSYYQREWRNHFSVEREILTVIYQGLGFGKKDCLSVKYVIVFQTWRGSWEQEKTMWITNCIWWPEPQTRILWC